MPRANTLPCVVPELDSTQKPGTAEIRSAVLRGASCSIAASSNVVIATLDSYLVRSAAAVPVTMISCISNAVSGGWSGCSGSTVWAAAFAAMTVNDTMTGSALPQNMMSLPCGGVVDLTL